MTMSVNFARVTCLAALAAVAAAGCASPFGTQPAADGTAPKSTGWFGSGFFSSLTGPSTSSSGRKPAMAAQATNVPAKKAVAAKPKTKLSEDDQMKMAQLLAKGREMERQGNLTKSREAYESLVRQFPNESEPYHRLGVVCDKQKLHRQAELNLRDAIDRDPNNAEIHADLGFCYYLQGKLRDAESQTLHAVSLDRRNPRYRNNLALIFGQQGKYNEALEEFRLAGSEADAFYNLAFIYASQGQDDVAKKCFERALVADPQHEKAQQALESFNTYDSMPEEMRQLQDASVDNSRNTRPYIEGGSEGVVPVSTNGEGGRVAPASAQKPAANAVHSHDNTRARRAQFDNGRKDFSYPSTNYPSTGE
jgi:Flp pilus assembly protein TadD